MDLHSIEFTDEEKEIIENVGIENEDYAICAVFDHRNKADISYDEEAEVITVSENGNKIRQTVEMITDVCESSDPLDRIGVGVSMLEIAINLEQEWTG